MSTFHHSQGNKHHLWKLPVPLWGFFVCLFLFFNLFVCLWTMTLTSTLLKNFLVNTRGMLETQCCKRISKSLSCVSALNSLNSNSPLLMPASSGNHQSALFLGLWPFRMPHRGEFIVFIFLWLACFAQRNVLQVHPCSAEDRISFFWRLNYPLYVYIFLSIHLLIDI